MPSSLFTRADCLKLPWPDRYFDLVVGSPPYVDCPKYAGIDASFNVAEWIDFMLKATREAMRVSKGLVVWVACGVTRDGAYWPACEGFMYEAFRGGLELWPPCCWYKVDDAGGGCGIPGSGGKQGLRRDWEYCMVFKRPGPLAYANPTVHGHPPLFKPGGKARNRSRTGARSPKAYTQPKLTNPGNVIKARVGGNHMGDAICSLNEAPYPERLAAWWIEAYCPPLGRVLDPFSGSGTTACEAVRLGRHGYGSDLRQSQVDLGRLRQFRRRGLGGKT